MVCLECYALLAVNVHKLQLEVAVSFLIHRLEEKREGVSSVLRLFSFTSSIQHCTSRTHPAEKALLLLGSSSEATVGSDNPTFRVMMSSFAAHFRHLLMLLRFMPAA